MDNYYNDQKNDAGEESGGWANQMIESFLGFVKDKPKDSKIVDVGCYTGVGLAVLRDRGFTNLTGIDLVRENITKLYQKDIVGIALNMEDMSIISDQYFDILFMHHAIEHCINPRAAIIEAFRISKKGLIVFPIESDKPVVNPPHYYTFRSVEDVINVVDSITTSKIKRLESKVRLGKELWLYYE